MRFCLLQSAYTDENILKDHDSYPDPSRFINEHEFHHRLIDKDAAKAQIDAAVKEGFDFYINFMWGTPEDDVAGLEATEYLESLGLPLVGLCRNTLRKSKHDFYQAARAHGSPPVPNDDPNTFPVIVKAARSCASMYLTPKSICFTAEARDAAIEVIDRELQPGRQRSSGKSEMPPSPRATIDKLPDDIIVQQFVPGVDYSVVIIEFGNSPIALNPTIYEYPPEDANNPNRFLTFDIKFSPALKEHLIKRDDDPLLFDKLQELAVQAYKVNGMLGGFWGNVDIRVQPNGEPVVIEVNPMPAIFLPPEIQYEDPVIAQSLPGGHRALLNILLANYFTRTGQESRRLQGIATTYDGVADIYDTAYLTKSTAEKVLTDVISRFDFSGSLLDLAAGTGVVGRIIRKCRKLTASSSRSANGSVNGGLCREGHVTDATDHHVGVDISPDMARVCRESGYESCYVGPMQTVLPTIPDRFDHIFCYQAIHFVSSFELSLVLSRCFQLARKSVTIGIDEIPDEYNKKMTAFNPPMTSINHVHEMRKFGIPCGWTLALEERHFGWRSPNVGVDVYTTIFHYERA